LLISLFYHQTFNIFQNQAAIQTFNIYYYKNFGSGNTLTTISQIIIQGRLTWLKIIII
ncbi:uncharacterized protein BO96DRAFT_351356, partial [Aspergillus niger CBS 101883]|uniref:uncharacterized protein n=1 Tax=Aspergillus lacticoffeatus (strain CBS 101883) TaxID=1450533 RepID=UPI000D7F35FB